MGKREVMRDGQFIPVARTEPNDDTVALERRDDGSIRRPGKHGRGFNAFFSEENLVKPITRRDYINLRGSEEYARREMGFLRRLWRWLTHRPPVVDMNGGLAKAHAKSIDALIVAAHEQKEKARSETGGNG